MRLIGLRFVLCLLPLPFAGPAGERTVYRSAADLAAALEEGGHDDAKFDFEATVVLPGYPREDTMAVADASGAVTLMANWSLKDRRAVVAGDRVRVSGNLGHDVHGETSAGCDRLERLGPGQPIRLPLADPVRLRAGAYGHQPVRIRGRVRSASRDELDPTFNQIVINGDGTYLHLSCRSDEGDEELLSRLVDAEIEAVGVCHAFAPGQRTFIRAYIHLIGLDSIIVLRASPRDPADLPDIKGLSKADPEELAWMGRRSVRGTVLAVWQRRNLLVRTPEGVVTGVELQTEPAPVCDERIIAGGFPETDLYRINLSRAVWRPDRDPPTDTGTTAPAEDISASTLLTDRNGRTMVKPAYHGRLVRLTGVIRDLPGRGEAEGRLILDCDGFPTDVFLPADGKGMPSLDIGMTVSVTGICLIRTHTSSLTIPLPKADGFGLALRSAADLAILSRPPWWTPFRLTVALAVLFAAFLSVLVWNATLRRLVDRRSRALIKEQIAHIGANLRVDERTRLAVELHDSLSQTLTGVSLQLDAVRRNPNGDPEKSRQRLDLAAETLHACRDELKDCLFDLRNLALDEPDFNAAVRKTLAPCLGDTRLTVRFNVARSRLSDATAHAVLRIVRELAANAIRHGHAKNLRIAGDLTDGTLSLSVRDDGCGFNPSSVRGPAEGHFGLQGIRERVRRLNGEISFAPVRDGGMKAVVILHLRTPEEERVHG